jgi:hypothetical protein
VLAQVETAAHHAMDVGLRIPAAWVGSGQRVHRLHCGAVGLHRRLHGRRTGDQAAACGPMADRPQDGLATPQVARHEQVQCEAADAVEEAAALRHVVLEQQVHRDLLERLKRWPA